jgi:hypothetical protein
MAVAWFMTPHECRAKAAELRAWAAHHPPRAETARQLAEGWDVVASTVEILHRSASVFFSGRDRRVPGTSPGRPDYSSGALR